MRETLLDQLRAAGGPVSGTVLAEKRGVTRAAIHKQMTKLRRAGYPIVGTNRVGYRWAGTVLPGQPPDPWAGLRVWKKSVGSTQDEAKERAARNAPEGTLVAADRQTGGRGRLGRKWVSPKGGLWYSLVLRPAGRPAGVPALTLVAALDWVEVLRERGVPAQVKWPNDVWAEGRKVAGILTEMSGETDRVHWVVLGVGLNVNNPPPRLREVPAFPAASVREWTGPIPVRDLLSHWVGRFVRSYAQFEKEGFQPFRAAFERRSALHGSWVSVEGAAGREEGSVLGVDGEGRLRVRTPRGVLLCSGGEVFRIRPTDLKSRLRKTTMEPSL